MGKESIETNRQGNRQTNKLRNMINHFTMIIFRYMGIYTLHI